MKTLHIMLIALCWVTQALAAPGQVASVNYTVIDQDGTPVPNANITAWIWTGHAYSVEEKASGGPT